MLEYLVEYRSRNEEYSVDADYVELHGAFFQFYKETGGVLNVVKYQAADEVLCITQKELKPNG